MKLGDKVLLAGREWTVRAFTAAEHQRFDELAAEADLTGKAARFQSLQAVKHGTARQKVLEADARRVQAQLSKYFAKNGDLKHGLTEEQRLEALTLAAELDTIEQRIAGIRLEAYEALLIADDDYTQTRETITARFMQEIIAPDMTPGEFHASLSNTDVVTLDSVVVVGKLRAGLSARDRRQAAHTEALLTQASKPSREHGSDSGSQQPPQDAQEKPGPRGRSKTSSSKSKGGNSEATKPRSQ